MPIGRYTRTSCGYSIFLFSALMQRKTKLAVFFLLIPLGMLMLNTLIIRKWTIRQTNAQTSAGSSSSIIFEESQKAYEIRKFISGSMKPTLEVDDRVFVDKLAYLETQPTRGDIILYSLPASQGKKLYLTEDLDSIHRIIGLPGETISIEGGLVTIDNQVLAEDYLLASTDYKLAPTLIPADSYFVLGDNRNASPDSHIWGSLSQDQIMGQVVGVLCPPEHQRLIVPKNTLTPEIQRLWVSGTKFFKDLHDSSQSCDSSLPM